MEIDFLIKILNKGNKVNTILSVWNTYHEYLESLEDQMNSAKKFENLQQSSTHRLRIFC